jgi:hypothetical protein
MHTFNRKVGTLTSQRVKLVRHHSIMNVLGYLLAQHRRSLRGNHCAQVVVVIEAHIRNVVFNVLTCSTPKTADAKPTRSYGSLITHALYFQIYSTYLNNPKRLSLTALATV